MKRIISLTIALCLVLGSFSFCFADFTSTDSTTLSNIYKYMPTASQVTTLNNTLSTISTRVLNIYNALFDGNHSVAYWVHAIDSFMSPIYTAIQNTPTELESIKRILGYVSYEGETEVIDPYLAYQNKGVAQWVSELNTDFDDLKIALTRQTPYSSSLRYNNAHSYLVDNSGNYSFTMFNSDGTFSILNVPWINGSPLGNIAYLLKQFNDSTARFNSYLINNMLTGSKSNQTYTLWNGDALQTSTFTPSSSFDGVYKWLSHIQEPVARLSYVLASDQDIEAREAAANNQQAVVDDFVKDTGTGSIGVSDFGSLSDASGAMKSNFNTGQSAAGVFNVFDDSHFLYLSQSAADQLDTTGSNNQNRLLKSSGSNYNTPALDRYYEELNKILEVNKDD